MTPERKAWWDSLPKEEKRVREDIDEFKRMIRHNKKHLTPYVAFAVAFAKYCIRYSKKAIKALRKQIGMRPISYGDHWKCPRCGRAVHYDFCKDCGQKMRWKKCAD